MCHDPISMANGCIYPVSDINIVTIVVVERSSAHRVFPVSTRSYCSSKCPTHPTRIQLVQSTTLSLCHYPHRKRHNPLTAVHDDDDCHEYYVQVGLACDSGDVGDEVVPDEPVAAKTLAYDQ